MWFPDFKKYQILICLLIGIYLTQIKVEAWSINGKAESEGTSTQHKEGIVLNKIYAENKFKCPMLFGVFPDVEDCSKFWICVSGIPAHMPCPAFRHFDKYRRKCLSIIVAICDKVKGKETTPSDDDVSTVKDQSFRCPSMFGTHPHPTDCSKYYTCSLYLSTLKTCPNKKLFDGIKKECSPENEVNCGSRNRPTSETTPPTTPLLPESTPEPTTPEVTTQQPTTLEPTTPEVTTQQPTTLEPTTPEVTTQPPTTPLETTMEEQTAPDHNCDEDDLDCIITETGEIPKWFKCPVELGSHRHPSSKKLFIFCINWKPYVKKCGQDLIYSRELETCVAP